MARHRPKNQIVDAEQFTGGEANAIRLTKWIQEVEGHSTKWWEGRYYEGIGLIESLEIRYFDERNAKVTEYVLDTGQKRSDPSRLVASATVGDWIIKEGNKFHTMNEYYFAQKYEKI